MAKQSIGEWKKEIAKKYNVTVGDVVPASSFASWGASQTGRETLAHVTSPYGGRYVVYGKLTRAQRKAHGA